MYKTHQYTNSLLRTINYVAVAPIVVLESVHVTVYSQEKNSSQYRIRARQDREGLCSQHGTWVATQTLRSVAENTLNILQLLI
jgi:Mg2+ and Co2+ transporter CorA